MSDQANHQDYPIKQLLQSEKLKVIHIGLERFAETYVRQSIPFVRVDWRPSAQGQRDMADMLAALRGKE